MKQIEMKTRMYLSNLLVFIVFNLNLGAQSLELSESLKIGNHPPSQPAPGFIQWNGLDFVGWNGEEWVSLTGGKTGPIKDIEGHIYSTVTVGNQVWMKENLKVSKFNNGDPIQHISQIPIWDTLNTSAWCWYGNDARNDETYGKLYNGYVILDSRNVCPDGWRIPNPQDLQELKEFVGDDDKTGQKLKEKGDTYWNDMNQGTNETDFSLRGAGYRADSGSFFSLLDLGGFLVDTGLSFVGVSLAQSPTTELFYLTTPTPGYAYSIRCIQSNN